MNTSIENNEKTVSPALARRLLQVLKRELVWQHRLLGIATQTRAALVARDAILVASLQERHAAALAAAENEARDREAVCADIARIAALPTANLTLSAITERLPGKIAIEISAVQAMLLEIFAAARETYHLNHDLIENEMEYLNDSVEFLARLVARYQEGAYGDVAPKTGGNNDGGVRSLLVNRAA